MLLRADKAGRRPMIFDRIECLSRMLPARLIREAVSHLKTSGTSYRLDETHVKVGKEWKHCNDEEGAG